MRIRLALPLFLCSMLAIAVLGRAPTGAAAATRGSEPVIQVDTHGGFVPVEVIQGDVPEVTVLADGRVITEGRRKSYDRMAHFRVARIDDARIQALLDQARDLGLLDPNSSVDYGEPGVTDMPDTTVTIKTGGDTFSTSVYALSFASQDLTPEQRANREALQAFIADTADASPRRPYHPKRLAVLATRTRDASGPAMEWPLEDLAVAGGKDNLAERCWILKGARLDQVLPLAEQARFGTRWHSGASDWTIVFRPLLPDERTCEDIGAV